MMRPLIAGMVLSLAATLAAAQAAVRVEPDHLQGPRELAEQTRQAAIRDYLESWKSMSAAFRQNQPGLLDRDFVGTARNKLADAIHEQSAAGTHTVYRDLSHDLQIAFYSPEGLSIELIDNVDYDMEVYGSDHLLTTQTMHARYVVLLTPAQVRWQVRVLQAE